jgi:hypothetical protein
LCGFYSRERLGASCERSRSRVMTLSEAVFFFLFCVDIIVDQCRLSSFLWNSGRPGWTGVLIGLICVASYCMKG